MLHWLASGVFLSLVFVSALLPAPSKIKEANDSICGILFFGDIIYQSVIGLIGAFFGLSIGAAIGIVVAFTC